MPFLWESSIPYKFPRKYFILDKVEAKKLFTPEAVVVKA